MRQDFACWGCLVSVGTQTASPSFQTRSFAAYSCSSTEPSSDQALWCSVSVDPLCISPHQAMALPFLRDSPFLRTHHLHVHSRDHYCASMLHIKKAFFISGLKTTLKS